MTVAAVSGWTLGHRPSLDSLRGVAVLLVIVGHSVPVGVPHGLGIVGVGLFFSLSGYLITGLLVGEWDRGGIRLPAFYLRRARRLLPALIVFVAVMLALGQATIAQAMPALFYYANLRGNALGVLGHTWSLAFEEQFYIAWPLLLIGALRIGLLARPAAVFVLCGLLVAIGQPWWAGLLAGCGIALVSRGRAADFRLPTWTGPVAALGLAATLLLPTAWAERGIVVLAPFVVAAVASRPALSWWPLERVGRISYGMYLWHFPIAGVLLTLGLPYPVLLATLVASTLAVAIVSWVVIERRLLRRLVGPAPTEHAASEQHAGERARLRPRGRDEIEGRAVGVRRRLGLVVIAADARAGGGRSDAERAGGVAGLDHEPVDAGSEVDGRSGRADRPNRCRRWRERLVGV